MAATSIVTTDWRALAKRLWQNSQIFGDGNHAVVNRCNGVFADVHLFETFEAAMAFKNSPCCTSCGRKHNYGSLVPYLPAPLPSQVRKFRFNSSLHRAMLSED
jgi:hypothetical protein